MLGGLRVTLLTPGPFYSFNLTCPPPAYIYYVCSEEEGGGQGDLLNIANWDVVDQYSVIELM